jgi:RNA polymerase primary sigma factor
VTSREFHESEEHLPNYLARLTQEPLLTAEEEIALTRKARIGDAKARQRLIESNMRLVINIARSYRSRLIPLEDLIQEGAIGLMHAVERYDPDKGFRLSTYATHWIRQAIGRAIDNKAKAIRVPAHVSQSLRRIEKERMRLFRELGHEPSPEQLAGALGLSTKRLVNMMQSTQELLSLDMKVGDSDNTTLGNLLRDDTAVDPEFDMLSQEVLSELHRILGELSERERRVMNYRLRMDPGTNQAMATDDLAKELQLSRERVRQIEIQAIKKLRSVAQRRRLRDLMSG